jgi:hypothetical protein
MFCWKRLDTLKLIYVVLFAFGLAFFTAGLSLVLISISTPPVVSTQNNDFSQWLNVLNYLVAGGGVFIAAGAFLLSSAWESMGNIGRQENLLASIAVQLRFFGDTKRMKVLNQFERISLLSWFLETLGDPNRGIPAHSGEVISATYYANELRPGIGKREAVRKLIEALYFIQHKQLMINYWIDKSLTLAIAGKKKSKAAKIANKLVVDASKEAREACELTIEHIRKEFGVDVTLSS